MSPETGKDSETEKETASKETTGYCLQLGSEYCRNECPNKCYEQFQEQIDKLFAGMDNT